MTKKKCFECAYDDCVNCIAGEFKWIKRDIPQSISCPKCKSDSMVTDSRKHKGTTRRQRTCRICNHRWNTQEIYAREYPKRGK